MLDPKKILKKFSPKNVEAQKMGLKEILGQNNFGSENIFKENFGQKKFGFTKNFCPIKLQVQRILAPNKIFDWKKIEKTLGLRKFGPKNVGQNWVSNI